MALTNKQKAIAILICLGLLILAYLGGKYSAPSKVVEVTKTIEKKVIDEQLTQQMIDNAKKEWEASIHKDVVTVTKVEYSESGKPKSRITETKIVIDKVESEKVEDKKFTVTIADKKESTEKSIEIKKEVTYERPGWRVAALAGVALDRPGQLIFSGTASRRLWGSSWLDVSLSANPHPAYKDSPEWRLLAGPAIEF